MSFRASQFPWRQAFRAKLMRAQHLIIVAEENPSLSAILSVFFAVPAAARILPIAAGCSPHRVQPPLSRRRGPREERPFQKALYHR